MLDKIILQSVISNRLDTIAEEMGTALEKSSRSPIFAESCDFACGVMDGSGDLVSQLNGIPILAAAGSFSTKAVIEKYGDKIEEGDIYIVNDPYYGGNHLPDIGIITPVFYGVNRVFFTVSRAHHGDIGGAVAGSYNTKATEIFQEGIRIPPTKIASKGEILWDVLDFIIYNTRNPKMLKSDLFAQIGANEIGKKRLLSLLDKYGLVNVSSAVEDILEQGENLSRKEISKFPQGTYVGEEFLDDDGFQDIPIGIKASVTFNGEQAIIDFTGTDPQVQGFVNSSLVTTKSASYIGLLWALSPKIPRNSGAFRPIKIIAPEGTLVNPLPPAPVTLSTLHCASEIIAAVLKACAKAVPERIPAGFGRYCGPSFYGTDPRNDKYYVGFTFCSLGSGGGKKGQDGYPYMAAFSNYGGVRAPNNEVNEIQYPILTLRHLLEEDTAGAGEFRGAPGLVYEYKLYGDNPNIVMFGDGMKIPPYSLKGGKVGSLNKNYLHSDGEIKSLKSKASPRTISSGDIITLHTSGGGGWGNPLHRKPEKVCEDVKNGYISTEKASEDYGVIIENMNLDKEKTKTIRERRFEDE